MATSNSATSLQGWAQASAFWTWIEGLSAGRLCWIAMAGFSLLSLILFGDFLLGIEPGIASNPIGDGARFFMFMRHFGFEQLRAGNLALWNPHLFSGAPFVGNFQSAMFYPPNLIYLFLPLATALNLDFAMHLALLGLFVFLWLRGRALHPLAAFFAAATVMLGGPNFLRVLAGQLTVLNTLVWSPLLFLVIDRLSERSSFGWTLLGILAVTLMLLAGHPPTVFMTAVVTALYTLPRLYSSPQRKGFILALLPIAIAPLLLSAVQLWTGLQVGEAGIRAGGMDFKFATTFSFPPENLLTLLAPEALGNADNFKRTYYGRWFYWDTSAYMGVVGFGLAIFGAIRGRSQLRWVSLLLAVFLVLLSLGRYSPVYAPVFDLVPGFDRFRAPSKFMFHAIFFAAALAGIGVDRLIADHKRAGPAAIVSAALMLLACGLAYWAWRYPPGQREMVPLVRMLANLNEFHGVGPTLIRQWNTAFLSSIVPSAIVLAMASVLLALARRYRACIVLVVLLGLLELMVFAHSNRGGARLGAESLKRPNLAQTYARAGQDRVLLAGRTSNLSMLSGGYDLWGYDPVVLGRYARFMAFTQAREVGDLNNIGGEHPDSFHHLLSMLRGRFRVDRAGVATEYPNPYPRFLLMTDHRVEPRVDTILAQMSAADFNPRQTIILEQEPIPVPQPGATRGSVRLLSETTDSLELEVELDSAAILVITDAYAEGWRVRSLADGPQTDYQLLAGNYVLRATPMEAGYHHLLVEYAPFGYRAGLWVSLLSSALLLAAVATWRWRRRSS